jgi:asparagine synthase (glutamine-hydrolysing)
VCGIAGAIGIIDDATVDAVHRMDQSIVHRGPDDHGWWTSELDDRSRGVLLAQRRLAIIDLSRDAAQPMIDPETGNAVTYNGEIYNYRELRAELEKDGAVFRTQSDTEVLLKAYGRWRLDFVHRLRGMFAFVIWDRQQQQAVMGCDRLGIKPLYWARVSRDGGQLLLFASELRAVLNSGMVPRRLDPTGLATYLWNGFVVGPGTIVRGVRHLSAGSMARVRPDEAEPREWRYWELPTEARESSAEELGEAVSEAVRMRLVSDVPLGIFLSGGVDSSAVAALAARSAETPVRTFNVSFDEAEYDESTHARAVATALGTEHLEVRLSQSTFLEQLPAAMGSLDQPTFDAINTYVVSRAVREAGVTVALAGTGGDELFGGYRSFVDVPRAARVARWLRGVPEPWLERSVSWILRAAMGPRGEVPPQTRWGKLSDVLAARGDLVETYQTAYGLFTRGFLAELGGESLRTEAAWGLPSRRAEELEHLVCGRSATHAVSLLELSCFIGERLLRDTDATSMAVSLEVRVPLLDHVVVEKAAGVPPSRRFEPMGRKELLRRIALQGLDPTQFDRPKRGFVLPIDVWCRQELKEELSNTFADREQIRAIGLRPDAVSRLWRAFQAEQPGIYWSRVWALYVLLWWCREHGVAL